MATIRDVARRAKVSVGTVSNVLSEVATVNSELRTRVHDAMRALDFHPNHMARSLKSRRTYTLGMVISDITNPFFPQLVRGAEEAALGHGYLLVTFNTDDKVERERRALSILRARRMDGVLLVVSPGDGDISHLKQTVESGIPVVCLDRVAPGIPLDTVLVDNVKGAQVAVRHLIREGHRQVAIMTGDLALQNARERLRGYEAALEESGIKADPGMVVVGDFREESAYRLAKDMLLWRRRPTALFVSSCVMALGVLHAMNELGLRCPEDVALASFDDLPGGAAFRPQVTSVAQPAFEIGFRGAELLIDRIEGRLTNKRKQTVVLEPELKIRESSTGRAAFPHRSPARG